MNYFQNIEFYKSCLSEESLPRSDGEIVLLGRSNAGKSTLINTIVQRKICFTSKIPGKTITINFLSIDQSKRRFMIDLPGYGFAASDPSVQEKWRNFIPQFLSSRTALKKVYILIDAKVGITNLDEEVLFFVQDLKLPFAIVLNKMDKASKAEIEVLSGKIQAAYGVTKAQLYIVSGKNSLGDIKKLRHDMFTDIKS